MHHLTAQRTLVKSPPELWSELSELERLARHLGAFGEIEITRLEPEHTVAWEGEVASGTVSIEPSGWGTRVTLSAQVAGEAAPPDVEPPAPEPEQEPIEVAEEAEEAEAHEPIEAPEPRRGNGFLRRLLRRGKGLEPVRDPVTELDAGAPAPESELEHTTPEPEAVPEPSSEPAPAAEPAASDESGPAEFDRREAQAVLEEALEALGSAHHRPFSRG